jgi:hypothetical protein
MPKPGNPGSPIPEWDQNAAACTDRRENQKLLATTRIGRSQQPWIG